MSRRRAIFDRLTAIENAEPDAAAWVLDEAREIQRDARQADEIPALEASWVTARCDVAVLAVHRPPADSPMAEALEDAQRRADAARAAIARADRALAAAVMRRLRATLPALRRPA